MDVDGAVETLMERLETEEVGGWFDSGGRAFALPKECAQVVGALEMSAFP